jgi:hypothetical protein
MAWSRESAGLHRGQGLKVDHLSPAGGSAEHRIVSPEFDRPVTGRQEGTGGRCSGQSIELAVADSVVNTAHSAAMKVSDGFHFVGGERTVDVSGLGTPMLAA